MANGTYADTWTMVIVMARTTGFTAAAAARMIGAGRIREVGVRFPEQVFVGSLGDELLPALADRGLTITHSEQ